MRFYPESMAPEYKAESDVWDIVKDALKDEDGVAWHGYRLYRKGRSYSYAPDIFILSRRYGAIVIECKGCQINNIYAIHNTVWQMEDWYKSEITPVSQVESQKYEVQNLLKQKLQHPTRLRFRVMVALPFITHAEWADKGFAEEDAVKPVALAENLTTVEGFLAWLDQRQSEEEQPYLTATEWSAIVNALGGGQRDAVGHTETIVPQDIPTTQPDPAQQERVVFLTYEGEPPHEEVLRKHLGLPYLKTWKGMNPMPDYWYLVPTAGLEWQRRNLAPTIQIQERLRRQANNQHDFGVKLLFRKALMHFMALGPKPRIATRVSELVHLRRVVFSSLDARKQEQVWRDRYAWIEALRAMEEQGLDLTNNPLEYEHLFVHPDVAKLMGEIQTGFRQQLEEQGEVTFEAAAREFLLSDDFQPPPLVIMEGFTRLTPLQLLFVDRCLRIPECTIWFIRPYRAAQAEGFEAIEKTYRNLLALQPKEVQETLRSLREPTALAALQRSLFSEETMRGEREEDSVVIEAYPTRQREVAACVQHLKRHLDANSEQQIAVVTRDPLKYRTLLREEAALLDKAFAERFDIPPAHLLLTPVGRFVLSLYDSWPNGRLVLTAEKFRSILASGWLGRRAKNSVPLFQSIEPVFFAHCEDYDSWQRAFTALGEAISESGRASGRTLAAWCTPDDAALWRKTMNIVRSLAQQLFDGQRRILSSQIERLQSTLETLDLQDVQEDEREIIRRILASLQSFVDSSELELDGEEVGEVLNSLIRQREDVENHERITVTGPESLDGLQKDIVYYLGVDEHRVPRAPGDSWPLAEIDIAQNQAQERYLFLAVVRAATKHLYLTYAEIDDRQACGPSLYLDEAVRTLERGQVPLADRPTVGERERVEATIKPIGPVQRTAYSVGELAQFQVCPRRYQLQRMTHTANYYRDSWQTQFLIQGALLTYTLAAFQTQYPSGVPVEEFPDVLTGLAFDTALAQAKAIYTGYTAEDWFFFAQQTRRRLADNATWIRENWTGRTVRVEIRQDASVTLRSDNGRTITMQAAARFVIVGFDDINGGEPWRQVYPGDLLAEEWLLPSKKDDSTDNSRYQAIQWWREHITKIVKNKYNTYIGPPASSQVNNEVNNVQQKSTSIKEIIAQVERGTYQARPGDQCRYCPVKSLCLGWQTGGLL